MRRGVIIRWGIFGTLLCIMIMTVWVGSVFNASAAAPGLVPTPDGFPIQDIQPNKTQRSSESVSANIQFEALSVEHGLSQSTVLSILQDRQGFMWFATLDGLSKYDGYDFQTIIPIPDEANSLSHRQVYAIAEDPNGDLWIGTDGGGVNRYNPSTDLFTVYRHLADDEHSLSSDFITEIFIDRSGRIWIGTLDGLSRYDPQRDGFVRYRNDPDDETTISNNQILAIYEDRYGELWVGTDLGGLNRFDRETQQFIHYRFREEDKKSLASDTVQSIYEDRNGDLWIGTGGGGLNLFNRARDMFIRYTHDPDDPTSISSDLVTAIYEDSLGDFWIGTYGGGLNRFDRARGNFTRFTNEPGDPESLASDYILSLYEDRTGVLWIGTNGGGLNKIERLAPRFMHIHARVGSWPGSPFNLNNNNIRAIYEDRFGVLWIGTNGGGLNMWDRNRGVWRYFKHDPEDPTTISNDIVQAIVEDDQGFLWVGTERGGLNRMDPTTGAFSHFRYVEDDSDSLVDDTILSLHIDRTGNLWIGTRSGGLDRYEPDTGEFVHYWLGENLMDVQVPYVRAIFEDQSGDLWFGVGNGGLFHLVAGQVSPYPMVFENGQPVEDLIVLSIFEDPAGSLWIGAFGAGLLKLNRLTGVVTQYRIKDGLPNDIVYGILQDKNGYLWLSTNDGLSRFDPVKKEFTNFNVDDGLQSKEFNPGAYFAGRSGEIFFGGINGFNRFVPAEVGDGNPYRPSIALISFRQDEKEFVSGRPIAENHQFVINWPNNSFDFEFVALSYIRSDKNQYAYMLENFDREWNYIGDQRTGRYTNLPAGDYTLRMKAGNNDGVWNEEGISVQVKVVPPFWETWWFISLVVMILFASVIGGYRLRVRSVELRSQELESLVDERTSELSEMNRLLAQEIRQRERIEKELAQRAAETAVTAERSRLARELHDAVTQTLFSASLIAEALPSSMENDPAEGKNLLDELRGLSRGALAEMRTLLLELRPAVLVEASLADLLRQLAEAATGREGLTIEVSVENPSPLPCDVHIALYRIAQEALNNVVKHARADRVWIDLAFADAGLSNGQTGVQVDLRIRDDGRGFHLDAVPPNHLGLGIMRERAHAIGAKLAIISQPGQGAQITVNWCGDGRKESEKG